MQLTQARVSHIELGRVWCEGLERSVGERFQILLDTIAFDAAPTSEARIALRYIRRRTTELDYHVHRYESSTQLAITSVFKSVDALTINRTGSRVIISHRYVYDRDLTMLGSLPETTRVAALAPTLMRAYTYDSNGTIRTFDVTAPVVGTFPEIGPPRTPIADPGATTPNRMLVTPDGEALFVMGNQQIVLVPL